MPRLLERLRDENRAVAGTYLDEDLLDTSTWQERSALLDPTGIPDRYQPRLITIDDFTAEGSSAEEAWNALKDHDVDTGLVTFVKSNFYALDEATIASWGAIDIAWIDAGTPAHPGHAAVSSDCSASAPIHV